MTCSKNKVRLGSDCGQVRSNIEEELYRHSFSHKSGEEQETRTRSTSSLVHVPKRSARHAAAVVIVVIVVTVH